MGKEKIKEPRGKNPKRGKIKTRKERIIGIFYGHIAR